MVSRISSGRGWQCGCTNLEGEDNASAMNATLAGSEQDVVALTTVLTAAIPRVHPDNPNAGLSLVQAYSKRTEYAG